MSVQEMKQRFKGAKLVDFTGKHSGFQLLKQFDQEFIKLLRECQDGSKAVVVIDKGIASRYDSALVVRDHINLSGNNPLIGPNHPIGERFPVVQGIYYYDCLASTNKGVVAGLKEGAKPNSDEQTALREVGVDVCCYNMVPAMLVAAHAGWKVLGIILPEDASLSAEQLKELTELTGKN